MVDFIGAIEALDAFSGGPGDETYTGTAGADTINGNDGNDTLAGGGGGDTIDGGDGDDTLYSATISPAWNYQYYYIPATPPVLDTGAEVDTLLGGIGNDTLYGGYGDNLNGGSGSNTLLISFLGGTSGVVFDANQLHNGGSITVAGGVITNFTDVAWIQGSNFADVLTASDNRSYADTMIYGMGGDDTIVGGYYTSAIYGGDGNDHIDVSTTAYMPPVDGGAGDDTIVGVHDTQGVTGGDGNDIITGNGLIFGAAGNDTINLTQSFTSYNIGAYGDDGNDTVNGSDVSDGIYGNAGADVIYGNDGDDSLYSGGLDHYSGVLYNYTGTEADTDAVDFGAEHDRVYGGAGDDHLSIGYGDDADGGTGTNTLILGLGGAGSGVTIDVAALLAGSVTLGGGTISNIQRVEAIWGSNFGDTITLATQATATTVHAGGGDDHVTSGSSAAILYGDGGNDTLTGGNAGDSFHGGAGADVINGQSGDDTIYIDSSDDVQAGDSYNGGAGNDTLRISQSGAVDISAVTLSGIEALNTGDAYYYSQVSMTAAQLAGFTSLQVGTLTLTTGGAVALAGVSYIGGTVFNLSDSGNQFDLTGILMNGSSGFVVNGGAAADTITGAGNADLLYGGGGNDTVNGGDGDDTLYGGAGMDVVRGGAGTDSLVINDGDLVAGETYDGGSGTDTLLVNTSGLADLSTDTLTGIETLTSNSFTGVKLTLAQLGALTTISGTNITLANGGSVSLSGITANATFNLAAADTVFDLTGLVAGIVTVNGNSGNDTITGSQFDDTISGGAGNDRLNGAIGADRMIGGAGNDIFYVDNGGDIVVENPGEGTDEVRTTLASYTLVNDVENLTALLSTGQALNGNALDNVITGGAGNDVIDGKAGGDTMVGGAGNDLYFVDSTGDLVTEQAGAGTDEVRTTLLSYTLGANVENLTGLLATAQTLTGNELDNVITGGTGNDNLFGAAGNDTIDGGNGIDRIHGGLGLDTLHGGVGNDEFDIDSSTDAVAGELYDGGDGTDIIVLTASNADLSSVTLTSIERIDTANHTATLSRAQLASFSQIGAQSPAFEQLGAAFVLTDSGAVTLTSQLTSLGLTIDLAAGGNSIDLSGMTTSSSLAHFYVNGHEGDDVVIGSKTIGNVLNGGGGSDTLVGGAGLDILNGGTGVDQLYGGLGNDTYNVDQQADLVFENAGEGADTVISTSNFYLYANIENLTLAAGAGNIFGVGNELANTITGNEGDNTLLAGVGDDVVHAGAGVDIVYGESGNDQLFGDAGNDFIAGGDGNDVIDGGTGGDSVYGEAGNDTLYGGTDFVFDRLVGGDGNDVLHGDSGLGDYDHLYGNAGDDSFYVDTGDDLTFENAGEGTDTVYANVAGANNGVYLYANVENLVLLGTTTFGVGNELDNHLTGNASGNYLLGGAGNDLLNGKGGNDVLFGEAGADTFVFEHGTGGDVIGDFQIGVDKIDLTAIGYTWQQVQNSLHENGGNTAIDLGGGDLVVLNGVTAAQLSAGDFILASSGTQAAAPALPAHAFALDLANDNGMLDVTWHEAAVPIDTLAVAL